MIPAVIYDHGNRHLYFKCPFCQTKYNFRSGFEPQPRQAIMSRCVNPECRKVFTGSIRVKETYTGGF